MTFQLTLYVLMYGVTTVIMALTILYIWRVREAPGGVYFALLLVAGFVWALCSTLEMASVDLWLKVFFSKLSYIGIVSIGPLWLLFNLAYNQRSRYIKGKLASYIWAIPVVILGLVATDEWHHLIWTDIAPISPEPGALLVYAHGPGVWLLIAFSYPLMFIGTVLLLRTSLNTYRLYSRQTITLLLGAVGAWSGNILYYFTGASTGIDPTPITICATGLLFAWSMYRYQLFDLVPVARTAVITNMKDGVVVLDDRDRVIDLNPAARQLLGSEEFIGKPMADALGAWPELLEQYPALSTEMTEIPRDRRDGTWWYTVRVSPLRDNRGEQNGRILILRDVSRRKRDEKALNETWHNLETLFDGIDEMIFILDSNATVLDVNFAFLRRTGYERDELIGHNIMELQRLKSEESKATLEDVLNGKGSQGPRFLTAKDGTVIPVETHLAPGRWGGSRAIFGVSRDITTLLQQQEELGRANASLQVEAGERRRAEEQLESALHEKEVLLKEIHHRVRDNMQIITSLLSLRIARDKREDVIAAFRESQCRIGAMALVHEKFSESRTLTDVNFGDYIHSLAGFLKQAYPRHPEIGILLEVEDISLDIDTAAPVGLILSELLTNSLRHAYPPDVPGTILVRLARDNGRIILDVRDEGVGLPAGLDFRQASTLGLELVNTLVEQVEGSIELLKGRGVDFRVTFAAPTLGAKARVGDIDAEVVNG